LSLPTLFPYTTLFRSLDLLRVSIDGAFPENYERYRVGGNLNTVLQFLKTLRIARRQHGRSLQVEWKYILFEWNDSDDEIRRAIRSEEHTSELQSPYDL